jgi:hypothetical protein
MDSSLIPDTFSEVEGETILRTLVDFKLIDSDGNQVSFDELGEGKSHATAYGYVLEPLPQIWLDKLPEMLCSYVPTYSEPLIEDPEIAKKADAILNASELVIGDTVDAYCPRTFKWFEAKIVDKQVVCGQQMLKLHFKGWNEKFDEFIDINSNRIAPLGKFTDKAVAELLANRRKVVPWYKNSEIYTQVI